MANLIEEKFIYTPAVKNSDAIPMWFCFPATYMIGMCSLGYLHLFRLFDENPDIHPERIFTDTEKTHHNLKDVEVMGFSVSFEFDFLGIFSMLQKYNIPLRSKDRNDNYPLIFGGGPVMTANPEPFAEFFDVILVGEGEEALNEMMTVFKTVRDLPKKEQLLALSKLDGVYIPSFYDVKYAEDGKISSIKANTENVPEKINRRHIEKLHKSLNSPILTSKSVFPNMFLVETSRGCPKMCKFCIASFLTLPARYPLYEEIKKSIDLGLQYSNKIGLLGALITEHPDFEKICEYITELKKERDIKISVSSLRVDTITPLIIKTLVECGQKQTTVAIEAGSERLRHHIGKKLSEEDIFKGVQIARENGLTGLKLYGMIGLPSETQEDIEAFVDLMIRLKKANKGFNLTLSVSSFVPKAGTPFQWEERPSDKIISERSDYLRKELNKNKIIYKPTSVKWDYIQAIISRGDRRIAPLMEKVQELGGTIGSWSKAYKDLREEGLILPDFNWFALRKREFSEILPWELINSGLSKETLHEIAQK
jgi:radical SAM superfamily enzyme YgiQ (UPF0313 family)